MLSHNNNSNISDRSSLQNKGAILWSGFLAISFIVYFLVSSGDYSFLLVRLFKSNQNIKHTQCCICCLLFCFVHEQTFASFMRCFGFMLLSIKVDIYIMLFKSSSESCFDIYILKIWSTSSVKGLSIKTLELYMLVFLFRLLSIMRFQGYLPYDQTGDWFYHLGAASISSPS